MKRIIALFLVLCMLFSMLVACNSDDDKWDAEQGYSDEDDDNDNDKNTSTPSQQNPTKTPVITPNVTDTPSMTVIPTDTSEQPSNNYPADFPNNLKGKEKAFLGEKIGIVVSGGDYATRSIYIDSREHDISNKVNVAVQNRNKLVEDYLGVTISPEETVGMQGMVDYMRKHFSAPTLDLDIVGVYQYFDIGLAFGKNSGNFLDYNALYNNGKSYLNVDAPYWDKTTYDTLEYSGSAFWITGDLSLTWLSSVFVSYVNAEIWNSYSDDIKKLTGYTNIYDVVSQGEWTLDLILELNDIVHVNNDGNNNVVSLQDQHGFLTYTTETGINSIVVDALFSGCHITWTGTDSNTGDPKISFYNNNLKAYADTMYKLYNTSKTCLIDYNGDNGDQVVNRFADGNTLVTLNALSYAELYLGGMKDDYYIVPLPKLNKSQKNYATTVGDGVTQFGIPKTCNNVAAATATLELLGYFSYKLVTPAYYDEALKGKYTSNGGNSDAAKMVHMIRDSIYSDFSLLWSSEIGQRGGTTYLSWYMRSNIGKKNFAIMAKQQERSWELGLNSLLEELEQ